MSKIRHLFYNVLTYPWSKKSPGGEVEILLTYGAGIVNITTIGEQNERNEFKPENEFETIAQ